MVIYDTKNNDNGNIKGILYLNLMDVDYIVSKYGIDTLKSQIPFDYIEVFQEELLNLKKETKFSVQYYSILTLGIETDIDEKLLNILSLEIKDGNLFTKQELQCLNQEEIKKRITQMKIIEQNLDQASLEEIYKLRSYKMADFIISSIEYANKCIENSYEQRSLGNFHKSQNYKNEFIRTQNNLLNIGLSSDISESDYFMKQKTKDLKL